jgi:hypothetical protein
LGEKKKGGGPSNTGTANTLGRDFLEDKERSAVRNRKRKVGRKREGRDGSLVDVTMYTNRQAGQGDIKGMQKTF